MASITIRNLDEPLKTQLRIRAATHGRSMEDEARHILRATLNVEAGPSPTNLADRLLKRLSPFAGPDLPIPAREPMRDPPTFRE